MGSPSAILTLGLGSWSSINEMVTLGYGSSEVVEVGNVGFVIRGGAPNLVIGGGEPQPVIAGGEPRLVIGKGVI